MLKLRARLEKEERNTCKAKTFARWCSAARYRRARSGESATSKGSDSSPSVMQRQCCNTIPAERSAVADSEPPAPITFVYGNVGVDASFLRDINDYPVEGVTFRDITPLLGDAAAFGRAVDDLVACVHDEQISRVVGLKLGGSFSLLRWRIG